MKWLRCAIVAGLVSLGAATARADEGPHYAIGRGLSGGSYAAPEMKISTLAGDGVFLLGGQAGWVLARSVVVGGGGYATVNSVAAPRSLQGPSGDASLRLAYGGLRLGGILAADAPIHATFGLLIGAGSAWSSSHDAYERSDTFFAVEPDVAAEATLPYGARLALGGGWRIVGAEREVGFTSSRLGGPTATLSLRLGAF